MDKSARRYVFEGMELLPGVLAPFVEGRLDATLTGHWQVRVAKRLNLRTDHNGTIIWDQAALLKAINLYWREAFATVLGPADRALANELVDVRNRFAHNASFTDDDAERALDSMRRLMAAVGAKAEEAQLAPMRDAIIRERFAGILWLRANDAVETEAFPPAGVRPQRRFRQAEFETELHRMLEEARAAGMERCRVISRDLHQRVVGGSQSNRMPSACAAMWKLWREQGSCDRSVIHTTPSGRSSTIEIEYWL